MPPEGSPNHNEGQPWNSSITSYKPHNEKNDIQKTSYVKDGMGFECEALFHPLKVDKLTAVMDVHDTDKKDVLQSAWDFHKAEKGPFSEGPFTTSPIPFHAIFHPGSTYYKTALRIVFLATGAYRESVVVVDLDPKTPKTAFARIEFNPNGLGPDRMQALKGLLDTLFPFGWDSWREAGRVTRIDIAQDIENVALDDLIIRVGKKRCITPVISSAGYINTQIFGKGSSNQLVAYNRMPLLKTLGDYVGYHDLIRLEARLRPKGLGMSDLISMKNPFSGIAIVDVSTTLNAPDYWELFQDSARVRGVKRALSCVPKKDLAKFKAAMPDSGWWDPVAVWEGWPAALLESGLTSGTYDQ